MEGDEVVYRHLVIQLNEGHGYTLQGTPLIGHGFSVDQYGKALFFHPPGGIVLFWLLTHLFGEAGFPVAQILSYTLFFWSMMALARAVLQPLSGLRLYVVALLAAFTPIMTHVASRFWLDGPMLAFATLGIALFMSAVQRQDMRRAIYAAVAMGFASWVKSSVLMVLPGLLLLGWMVSTPDTRRAFLRLACVFTALTLVIQLPWEIWQWRVVGSPFPAWAGKPSAELVATNRYVHFLTAVRPPWMYLTTLPRTVFTLLPAIACLLLIRMDARARGIGVALVVWIGLVLASLIGLGAIGYSKLLRYAIMVTPATVLLTGLGAGEAWRVFTAGRRGPGGQTLVKLLLVLLAVGLVLEISQGVFTPLLNRQSDMIVPILLPGRLVY
jgi:4-amino-4-deoxy-L-arabinose transferase-like glycosyltransferase